MFNMLHSTLPLTTKQVEYTQDICLLSDFTEPKIGYQLAQSTPGLPFQLQSRFVNYDQHNQNHDDVPTVNGDTCILGTAKCHIQ